MNLTWVEMLLILLNFLHVEDYYHQTFLVLFVSSALVTYRADTENYQLSVKKWVPLTMDHPEKAGGALVA